MKSLLSVKSDANLTNGHTTSETELHLDFSYAKEIPYYSLLRGHYEVQIDSDNGMNSVYEYTGAIYDFLSLEEIKGLEKDEWQNYDIRLSGCFVTVIVNGEMIINNQEVPGIDCSVNDFSRIVITAIKD